MNIALLLDCFQTSWCKTTADYIGELYLSHVVGFDFAGLLDLERYDGVVRKTIDHVS